MITETIKTLALGALGFVAAFALFSPSKSHAPRVEAPASAPAPAAKAHPYADPFKREGHK